MSRLRVPTHVSGSGHAHRHPRGVVHRHRRLPPYLERNSPTNQPDQNRERFGTRSSLHLF